MSPDAGPPLLRVERALRLLPDVDVLAPLRAFLVSTSRVRPGSEPYRTVGKRFVHPAHLRELAPRAAARVKDYLDSLYGAAVDALDAEQRGNPSGIVEALVRAGETEERAGRASQAHIWYTHALGIAEELHDRHPEIHALHHLGLLEAARDRFHEAARFHQRCLALAAAELDGESAAAACLGLGQVELEQTRLQGATAWFRRGLEQAGGETALAAFLRLGLADVARLKRDLDTAAQQLKESRDLFERLSHAEGMARALEAGGRIESLRGEPAAAMSAHREALARLHGNGLHARLELDIRLSLAELCLEWDRLRDAEDELRQAEETAIVHNLTRSLVRLYSIMGELRGRQLDDTGFVFFEKAIELCRGPEPLPRLEAQTYVAYAQFRERFGDAAESTAYYERAREIFEMTGDADATTRIEARLAAAQTGDTAAERPS